jgi:hypothetical protein
MAKATNKPAITKSSSKPVKTSGKIEGGSDADKKLTAEEKQLAEDEVTLISMMGKGNVWSEKDTEKDQGDSKTVKFRVHDTIRILRNLQKHWLRQTHPKVIRGYVKLLNHFIENVGHFKIVSDMLKEKQFKYIMARAFVDDFEVSIQTLQGFIDKEEFDVRLATILELKASFHRRLLSKFYSLKQQ